MSNEFEKFVRQKRDEFDEALPSENVWEHIEQSFPAGKRAKLFSMRDIYKWSAAAAVLFIVLTSVYFLFIRKNSHEGSKTNSSVVTVSPNNNEGMTPDHAAEINAAYRSIGEQKTVLRSSLSRQPELYQQFENDLATLDSVYQSLKKQMEHSPNRDLIVEAMIQNLRLQAELLSRQLMISDQINNNQKKQSHEKEI